MQDQYHIDLELDWIYVYKVVPTGKKDRHLTPEYKILNMIKHGEGPTEHEIMPVNPPLKIGDTINLIDYDLRTKHELILFIFEDLIELKQIE